MSTFKLIRGIVGAAMVVLSLISWSRAEEAMEAEAAAAPAPEKAPPLPFHTIEGYGGGAITPMAYLVNAGPEECVFGKPAFAISDIFADRKNLTALTLTETLFGRVELGYAAERLGLGTLPRDIAAANGGDIDHSDVWLHNFNIRTLLVKENTCLGGFALPAVTAGIHIKVNDGIESINEHLVANTGGAVDLHSIGYRRSNGTDFTLTLTKTFPKTLLERPLIVTGGLRLSEAADTGFLGFGDRYHATFEGNVAYLPLDRLLVAYEFRQKTDPYTQFGTLIGPEDNWHAIDVGLILTPHSTLVAGYGHLGNLANAEANGAWYFQLKHEF